MNAPPTGACNAKNSTGKPCRAQAVAGGRFCMFHDPHPDAVQARSQGRRRGGRERSRARTVVAGDTPEIAVAGVKDVCRLLSDTINRVRKGTLDTRIANTIGYLGSVLIRAFEVGEMEERLARLESALRRDGSAGEGESVFDRDLDRGPGEDVR